MMNKMACIFAFMVLCTSGILLGQNTGAISGVVRDELQNGVPGATIRIATLNVGASTDPDGKFLITNIPAGEYVLTTSIIGYRTDTRTVKLKEGQNIFVTIDVFEQEEELDEIKIVATRDYNNVKHMQEVEETLIYSGKRNDVVILNKTNANTAENIPRQVFSKVPGVYEWDLDGTGAQISISVRGLSPHRSWEFNVRENGYTVNSDVFGYPESHYNPATEALAKIELVRGGACLQYGPQYGGMLNYVMKEGPTDKALDYESRQTVGSNGLFNTYNAVGGTVGKLNYYGYFNYRTSQGFRPNGSYDFYAGYVGLHYQATDKLRINFEYSKMYYVNQLSGGLNDAQFAEDPYQSTRSRNYFSPNHNIPALTITYSPNTNTVFSLKSNMILGQRNSVMFIAAPTVKDSIIPTTLEYAPRTVDRDYYTSIANEARILQYYTLGGRKQVFSAGFRFSDSRTKRQQGGVGTTGTDFDLSLIGPYARDLKFITMNYAFCAENLFHIGEKLSVTPGFRYEIIQTNMTGSVDYLIDPFLYDKDRMVPLAGLGIQFNFTKETNIYANWSQAYRPILYSDITPAASLDVIDPDMTDSKGFNSDLGVRGKVNDVLTYDIGIYYLLYGDRVGALALHDDMGQTYIYRTNVGTSAARGVESFIEFRPTALKNVHSTFGQIGIFLSATYDNATYIDALTSVNGEEVQVEGNKLENAPEWIVRSGISYNYKWFSTTIQGSYVSEIYSDALNTASSENGVVGIVPSYFILDWNTTIRFSGFNIKAGLNNMNNEVYFTRRINNYPGPGILPADGRTFYISFGKEF
ncbi:MAG: carboxypeptidase-like regulatory domain-containing protein [Chitinophagales bacterium]